MKFVLRQFKSEFLSYFLNYRTPFKASHVTRRPSLKWLSGCSYLFEWETSHSPNWSPSLRLNCIFKITNAIWQQLYHKSCLFCSNSKKLVFQVRPASAHAQSSGPQQRWLFLKQPGVLLNIPPGFGPIPNGTLHVHLRYHGLTMAAASIKSTRQ